MPSFFLALIDGRMNRTHYVAVVVVALYLLPLLLSALFRALGIPLFSLAALSSGPVSLMAFWYLQIPLFAWATLRRVQDVGWPRWAAAVLWLPIVNFVLWFWPGQVTANRWGEPPPASGRWVKGLAYGAPLWIILSYLVLLLVLVKTGHLG